MIKLSPKDLRLIKLSISIFLLMVFSIAGGAAGAFGLFILFGPLAILVVLVILAIAIFSVVVSIDIIKKEVQKEERIAKRLSENDFDFPPFSRKI